MYKINKRSKTSIEQNTSYIGENIELRVKRLMHDKAPIDEGAPIIFTAKEDGVLPQFDIRTDRMELLTATIGTMKNKIDAKRAEKAGKKHNENPPELDGIGSSLE